MRVGMVMTRSNWMIVGCMALACVAHAGCAQEHINIGAHEHGSGEGEGSDAGMACEAPCEPAGAADAGVGGDEPRVFRMDSVVLADPHVVADRSVDVLPSGLCRICQDVTHSDAIQRCAVFFVVYSIDVPGINPAINDLVTADGTGDGFLDLSFMLAFDGGGSGALVVTEGLCDAADPTSCAPDPGAQNVVSTTYASQASGTCLEATAGAVGPLTEVAPNAPAGSCFVSAPSTLVLPLVVGAGDGETVEQIDVPLQGAQVAGQWQGDPATGITNGLLKGFLSMQDADQIDFDVEIDLVGTVNINLGRDLLPDNGNAHGCGAISRTFPAGGTDGSNEHALGEHLETSCAGDPGDSRDLFDPAAPASYTNCGWWFHVNWSGHWASNASGF
jgi:hypothetical protein